jgi:acyl-CoA synthetase (NDP forming)
MVGTGGIYANYVSDVAFELAHGLTAAKAREQLEKTKIYQILSGVRGEKPSDIDGLVDMMLKIAQFVSDNEEVRELDMNPVLVFEKDGDRPGVAAIDMKVFI